jgi:hypothetical protein
LVSVLRSRSVIDDIGTIEYDALRTVIVLRIQDVNDNRPQFNETSPLTVGYPSAKIANQLLPPYLAKIQVMRAHAVLASVKHIQKLGLFYSLKCFIRGNFKASEML